MSEGQHDHGAEHEDHGAAARRQPTAGKATLTSRLGASPGSIARAVIAQLKEDAGAGQARGALDGDDAHALAAHGTRGGGGALPHLAEIQRAFGPHDVSGVRAHVGGAASEASAALGAHAYAAGDDVAFAAAPDLHLAAHEAAHVVQQRGGVRLSDGLGQAGDAYEQHADAVADAVVRGEYVAELLGGMAHRGAGGGAAVQRKEVLPVKWGTDLLGDGSTLTLRPVAEVWVNGKRTSSDAITGNNATVQILPGQSGEVRVALGVNYDIEATLLDDTGFVEEVSARRFTCDAAGVLRWGGDLSAGTPPPSTTAFNVDPSSAVKDLTMTAIYKFAGPSRTISGAKLSAGAGKGPISGELDAGSTTTAHPAGGFLRQYHVQVLGPVAAASDGGGDHAGGNGGNANANANANANGGGSTSSNSNSNSNTSHGGAGGNASATGGTATGGNASVHVHVEASRGGEVTPPPQEHTTPAPAAQLPEPFVAIYDHDDDHILQGEDLDLLTRWLNGLPPDVRQELEHGRLHLEIETQANTRADDQHNDALTNDRAAALDRFVHARHHRWRLELSPLGEHAPDGIPRVANKSRANFRRATIRVVR